MPRLVRARFDGSRLGSVELSDGSEFLVEVDVDSGAAGHFVHFSAFDGGAKAERWVERNQRELVDEFHSAMARGEG